MTIVDCDIHPVIADATVLLSYLDDHWREQVVVRGINQLDIITYPPKAPLVTRADWRSSQGRTSTSVETLRAQALDVFRPDLAICNVVWGGQAVFNADLGAALCGAVNRWLADEWLDRDDRLRASIVVPVQDPVAAVEEIERHAGDRRFVQVLMPAGAEVPLGRRHWWPIYRAAERHGLPVGIHAGNTGRFPSTYVGWPSYFIEEYYAQAQTFQGQLLSLIYEGVFEKHPGLKVVLIESGVSWLPSMLSRANNTWRALRMEFPWLRRSPSEVVRDHVRFTAQPFDVPADPKTVETFLSLLDSDELLLFASDYPHWQFDGDDPLPPGLPDGMARRIMSDNPLETYPRLKERAQ